MIFRMERGRAIRVIREAEHEFLDQEVKAVEPLVDEAMQNLI